MFSDPVKNLKALGFKENDIVVDLGAGTGFYSVAAARMMPQGKVYAVEVEKDFVTTIKNKAKEDHLDNLECIWGDIEKIGGTKIGDQIATVAIVSNVLSKLEDKEKFIEETKRILTVGGQVLVVDWSLAEDAALPSPFASHSHIFIPKDKARRMFEEHGFSYERDIDAGAHHYGIILRKRAP